MNWLPAIDGQTAFSIAVGAVLTLTTFWLAYRKTIGAKEERVRAANQELVSAMIKRVAVDRQPLSHEHYSRLRKAKSYEKSIGVNRLLNFSIAQSILFSEIVSNNFLDHSSKNEIISLLDESAKIDPHFQDDLDFKSNAWKEYTIFFPLVIGSSVVGLLGTSFFENFARTEQGNPPSPWWVEWALLALIAIFVAFRLYSVLSARTGHEQLPPEIEREDSPKS